MSIGIRQVSGFLLSAGPLLAATLASAQSSLVPERELRLLSAASMQTVFKEILGDFERRSGYKVSLRYSTMGAITDRVANGEQADLVISSPGSIAALVSRGLIDASSEVQIAKTGVGIVIPAGDPALRIDSVEDFKQALLAARVVVYANPAGGGAAGVHIAKVVEKLGIAEVLKPKTKYGAGGDVAEVTIAQGPGALGLTQVSEIVGKPGMQFVPVPDALQNYTGFVAGTPRGAQPSQAVKEFIAFLRTPEAVAVMKAKGMRVE
jgi:molybdate transport system substrate-binding protein